MAYELDIDPEAREQLHALPTEIRPAVAEVMAVLELVPWNGVSLSDANPDGEVWQLVFGPLGKRLITYLILEDQLRVDVLRVHWLG